MVYSPSTSPSSRQSHRHKMRQHDSPPCSPHGRPIHESSSLSSYSAALPIRRNQGVVAPPPLPPPQVLNFESGHQSAWDSRHPQVGTGTLSAGSSLLVGWPLALDIRRQPFHRRDLSNTELSPSSPLREYRNSQTMIQDEPQPARLPSIDAGPLETNNHQKSTESYDRRLLSKIGRPKTPVRKSAITSSETSPLSSGNPLCVDTQPAFHKLSLADRSVSAYPDSPFKTSSPFSWSRGPHSGTISPGMISSASTRSVSLAELRSPSSYDPSTAPSSLLSDSTTFSRIGSLDRGSNASLSLLSSAFDDSEHKSRQALVRGPHDSEFAAQTPASLRSHAADPRAYHHYHASEGPLPDMGGPQGIKRKASPSLGDIVADEPPPQATRSRTPGRTTKRASPGYQVPALPPYASHAPSYTSPTHPLAPSGMASYAPPDHLSQTAPAASTNHAIESRHHQPSYALASGSDVATPHSLPTTHSRPGTASQKEDSGARAGRDGGISATPIHVCDCCPKKPRKFNTLDDLQNHQREKQFYCTYCHNRFKNKNEAERHQNSLHLRKQSWSCAALGNKIDRAFHPCTATPSANPQQAQVQQAAPADHDVCGYCGKQYPNYPSPDWAERNKHLTEVHKFGECNQSKKFFRADHFRQHLKHSHQGSAGKWTNMLEQACLREEAPDTPLPDSVIQQQQQATEALQAVRAASQQAPINSYQVEALQAATADQSLVSPGMRSGAYPSAIGSHVPYEPKIDEEDESRA